MSERRRLWDTTALELILTPLESVGWKFRETPGGRLKVLSVMERYYATIPG